MQLNVKAYRKFLSSVTSQLGDITADNNQMLLYYLSLIMQLRGHGVAYSAIVQTYSICIWRYRLTKPGTRRGRV
ncbi:MAG: hypothetical protein JKX69_07440 [Rhodobacteraceae bacterium]|nr:hypothetical protein [Paracoccaceae bacterium]PHR56245.1 MAG: hypothetical protein COA47_13230 [Robiginitomaculum sp.]